MFATPTPLKTAPALRARRTVLRLDVRPIAFGNALANSLVESLPATAAMSYSEAEAKADTERELKRLQSWTPGTESTPWTGQGLRPSARSWAAFNEGLTNTINANEQARQGTAPEGNPWAKPPIEAYDGGFGDMSLWPQVAANGGGRSSWKEQWEAANARRKALAFDRFRKSEISAGNAMARPSSQHTTDTSLNSSARTTYGEVADLVRSFGKGVVHGAADMVWQPIANTIDLGQVAVGLISGGNYEPTWLSGIGQNYQAGISYSETVARAVLGSNPVTGVGLAGYDLTGSALRGDWGSVAEGAGGLVGGFGAAKYGQRYFAPEPAAQLGIYRVRPEVEITDPLVSPGRLLPELPKSEAPNFKSVEPTYLGGRTLNRVFDNIDAYENGGYWSEKAYPSEGAWRSGAAVPEGKRWNEGDAARSMAARQRLGMGWKSSTASCAWIFDSKMGVHYGLDSTWWRLPNLGA